MASSSGPRVSGTGGQVDEIVMGLLAHADDKEESVRVALAQSLQRIGVQQPELVLTSTMAFVDRRSKAKKLTQEHRVQCLKVIISVLEQTRDKVSQPVAQELGPFAAQELVAVKEVVADWQGPASVILSSLAIPFPDIVINELLQLFRPGALPHYYVIKTLGDVAGANGTALTLRLQEVLSRVMPVLGSVQTDPMRWAFAAALGRFSEAVAHFEANATESERARVAPDAFRTEMSSAFEVVFGNWLNSKEAKVRFAVVESLGYMCNRLAADKIEGCLGRLVPTLLAMYKKEPADQHLPISHGLAAALRAAVSSGTVALDQLLPPVLAGLHPMLATEPDFRKPPTVKNHNEMLRCFEIVGRARLEEVLSFVTNRFPTKEVRAILASLLILRHMVNAMDDALAEKKPSIISSVQALTTETDLQIRKSLLQLVVGMANQNYLQLPGGEELVRFLVRQAAISDAAIEGWAARNSKGGAGGDDGSAAVSPQQIRNAANHVIRVMSTKVPATHCVLWPFMAELLNQADYSAAILVVCRSVADIVTYKREQGEEVSVDFERHPDVPRGPVMMARLMVLANVPHRQSGLGEAVLDCMAALAPLIHPACEANWGESVPALLGYLEEHPSGDGFPQTKWQDTLLKVFRATVDQIGPGAFQRDLVTAVSQQYALYKHDAILSRAIHRYLGALLASVTSREVVSQTLDLILGTVDHNSDVERQGCAQGLGLAASQHLDAVLPKITSRLQELMKPKKRGLFSFGSSADDHSSDQEKATLVLCYGYVVAYAEAGLISSRLDAHVMPNLLEAMKTAATEVLQDNCVKAADLIGKAMHPARLPAGNQRFVLKDRNALVGQLLRFLGRRPEADQPAGAGASKGKSSSSSAAAASAASGKGGESADAGSGPGGAAGPAVAQASAAQTARLSKLPAGMLTMGLNALTTLVNLPPFLDESARRATLDTVLPSLSLPAGPAAAAPSGADDEAAAGDAVLMSLNTLLSAMLQAEPTLSSLSSLLQRLEFYVVDPAPAVRIRACSTYLVVLKKFVALVVQDKVSMADSEFLHLGHYLATMLPRCADPSPDVRATAAEDVQALLYVDQLLRNPHDPSPTQELKLVTQVRDRLAEAGCTAERRQEPLRDLAGLLGSLVRGAEFSRMLSSLYSGLSDPEPEAAGGAALILSTVTERRSSELAPELVSLVDGMVRALGRASGGHDGAVAAVALRSLRSYAWAHFKDTMDCMLDQSLPLQPAVSAAFRGLVTSDTELAARVVQMLVGVVNDTPVSEGKPAPRVMVATAALGKIIAVPELRPLILSRAQFSRLLGTLLMRVGSAYGSDAGQSSSDAIAALRTFVAAALGARLAEAVDSAVATADPPPPLLGMDPKAEARRKEEENAKKARARQAAKSQRKQAGGDAAGAADSSASGPMTGGWALMQGTRYDDGICQFVRELMNQVLLPSSSAAAANSGGDGDGDGDSESDGGEDGDNDDGGRKKRGLAAPWAEGEGRGHALELVRFLGDFMSERSYFGQRAAATATLAQTVEHCGSGAGDAEMLDALVRMLLPRVADAKDVVRRQAMRGLGNLEGVWNASANRSVVDVHAASVLSALTSAAEDRTALVAGEAVASLTRVARVVSEDTMLPMLISICFRLRPAFDRSEEEIRTAAFSLFGELVRFGEAGRGQNFMDQVHSNIPILCVHMSDENEGVREACHRAFSSVASLVGPDLVRVLGECGHDPESFDAFAEAVAPVLVTLFPGRLGPYLDTTVAYFKSKWGVIRGSAVTLTAHLLASAPAEARQRVNLVSFCGALTQMLNEDSGVVRVKTARALSLLHNI